MQREVKDLSGGELQRFAIGVVCVKKADVYVTNSLSLHYVGGSAGCIVLSVFSFSVVCQRH